MIFTTYWFVFFAAIFFPVYWCSRKSWLRSWWLLAGCATFHGYFAGPAGVVPIIVLGSVTYFAARSQRRGLCLGAIVLCVSALVFYKYTFFLCSSLLGSVWPALRAAAVVQAGQWLPSAPPLGISFFVFEFVGEVGFFVARPVVASRLFGVEFVAFMKRLARELVE